MGNIISMFTSKPFIRLVPTSQPGSFFPLHKVSNHWMFYYCVSLHLTTLIQSVFDRQGVFLVPDLLFPQHWSHCCMNGELSEMALSHPRCLLIMPIYFSFRVVCGKTTVLPPNMKWQRVPFWLCGSKISASQPSWKGFPGGLLLTTPGIDFWN